jgi:hypothetical protein
MEQENAALLNIYLLAFSLPGPTNQLTNKWLGPFLLKNKTNQTDLFTT